jgi:phosphoglycolate phosphatase
MKRVLIFDYDGTILDSLEVFIKNFINACKKNGFEKIDSKAKFLKLFEKNLYDGMIDFGVNKEKIPKILEDLKRDLSKDMIKLQLFGGVKEMLKELSKENKMIIITSNVTKVVEDSLKSKNINCFEEVIGADKETSKVKKIESVKSKFKNYEYFYIGDTKGDMLEGKKAGAKTIAAAWGWHNKRKLKEGNPDFVVDSPEELVKLFEK